MTDLDKILEKINKKLQAGETGTKQNYRCIAKSLSKIRECLDCSKLLEDSKNTISALRTQVQQVQQLYKPESKPKEDSAQQFRHDSGKLLEQIHNAQILNASSNLKIKDAQISTLQKENSDLKKELDKCKFGSRYVSDDDDDLLNSSGSVYSEDSLENTPKPASVPARAHKFVAESRSRSNSVGSNDSF